jgi:hypothetical protein
MRRKSNSNWRPWLAAAAVIFGLVSLGALRARYFPDFITKGPYVDVRAYGVMGDGQSDDTSAIAAAFGDLSQGQTLYFPPGRTYKITSEINCNIPAYSTVIAYGATFKATHDGVLFDVNSSADPADTSGTVKRQVRWRGGYFWNTAGTRTASEALRLYCFRNLVVSDAYFEGFWKSINFDSLDTFTFEKCYFWDNTYAIYNAQWATDGTSIGGITVTDCSFTDSGATSAIYIRGDFSDLRIENNSFGGDHDRMIDIRNTDSSSGPTGIMIRGNHFEQAAAGDYYVYLNDTAGSNAFSSIVMMDNFFGGSAPDAVKLERAGNIFFAGNRFSQTTGKPIDLDANCWDITIDRSNRFSTGDVSFACARDEISFEPSTRTINHVTVTGYNGNAFSDNSTQVDMSANFSPFPGDAPPKGYWFIVQASDSGSAANNTWVRIAKDSGIGTNLRAALILTGVANDQMMGMASYVPADGNGDIFVEINASGTDTLDIWLNIVGIDM